MVLSAAYEQKGMLDQAVEATLKRLNNPDAETLESLRNAYRKFGIKGFRQKQIEVFQNKEGWKKEIADYEVAARYALLNQSEAALHEIEKGFLDRGSMWSMIHLDPAFDSLRENPRFQELVNKIGLPG